MTEIITVQVSDSGKGIVDSHINQIFNFFEQEDNSTSWKFGGSGLGLTITKQLIELMDGYITVQRQSGEGSAFTMSFKTHY
ncbi:hypothetical protein ACH42_03165 [Endozoicomonas sp. (ex Bugula neritina AB1)]|nr:hypothetical protein ACH42_03165 [Endozoicomonas sp. (ex Bugula neritina AB1)]